MSISNKREAIILFLGDLFIFFASLFLVLAIRYGEVSSRIVDLHLAPFSILFGVWIIVFFIAGLYDAHTTLLKGKLPSIVFHAQLANTILAVLFFYFIPYFGIAPKTNLFLCLLISFIAVLLWRRYGYKLANSKRKETAILLGSGPEIQKLHDEINSNERYGFRIAAMLDTDQVNTAQFSEEIRKKINDLGASFLVLDLRDAKIQPLLPSLYPLLVEGVRFADLNLVYENIFDRLPVPLLKEGWILEHITNDPKPAYDFSKRLLDVVLGIFFGIVTLPFYPLVWLLILIQDRGPLLIRQKRVGQHNEPITLFKFRTMRFDDGGEYGNATKNEVTKIGNFLRKTRIDEFPQFWNIVKGDLSFVGPRPELPHPAKEYSGSIPYYNLRHILKPGLSGWAQIGHDMHPHHGVDLEETKNKLSYDLYYVKNRSFMLDVKIIMRTIKIMILFAGK